MTVQICLLTTFFTAEQLRNVSAMDDVCALHHVSTSSLLALGYIVMYIYIYAYIHMCMYIYIVYVLYTTMHGNMCIYTHTIIYYIYNYQSAAECVGGHQMDREKKEITNGRPWQDSSP